MSEQLEAAVESMRQSNLALDEAEAKDGAEALGCAFESIGHLRITVNHLLGAVQLLERKNDR